MFNRTNTDFSRAIEVRIDELESDANASVLRRHQYISNHLITMLRHGRGQVAVHDMGQGKTMLAASVANWFRTNDPTRRVIVMLTKSLEANFKKGLGQYIAARQAALKKSDDIKDSTTDKSTEDSGGDNLVLEDPVTKMRYPLESIDPTEDPSLVALKYSFVSMNAGNAYTQVLRTAASADQQRLEKRLGQLYSEMTKVHSEHPLENTLIIVDEAHNLFRSIANGSNNGVKIYDLIMRTRNIKLLFLTGTPMSTDPHQLVPCFNMLAGREGGRTLFDEDRRSFENYFIEEQNNETEDSNVEDINKTPSGEEIPDAVDDTPKPPINESKSSKTMEEEILVKTRARNSRVTKHGGAKAADAAKHAARQAAKAARASMAAAAAAKAAAKETAETTAAAKTIDAELVGAVKTYRIKNAAKFGNRIMGLCSYYGSLYFEGSKEGFPTSIGPHVELVPMSIPQYNEYSAARVRELKEGLDASGERIRLRQVKNVRGFTKSKQTSSTYRSGSRLASSMYFPPHTQAIKDGKSVKFPSKLTKDDFVREKNPMMHRLLENIGRFGTLPGLVYSPFVRNEGIASIGRALETVRGYRCFNDVNLDKLNEEPEDRPDTPAEDDRTSTVTIDVKTDKKSSKTTAPLPKRLKYAIVSGDVPFDLRKTIIETFNKPENRNGALIQLLLISKSGAEGLDCKRVRHQHYFGPSYDKITELQFFARGARWQSHADLPTDQQNVTNYIYLADAPSDPSIERIPEANTTHIWMYERGNAKYDLIQQFSRDILMPYSIDCYAHKDLLPEGINCISCKPTNQRRFHLRLEQDLREENPCIQDDGSSNDEGITAAVGSDGVEYGHRQGRPYHYIHAIRLWRPMPADHPEYKTIFAIANKSSMSSLDKLLDF